jgi:hypothetical protein
MLAGLSLDLNFTQKQGCGSGSALNPDSMIFWKRIPDSGQENEETIPF